MKKLLLWFLVLQLMQINNTAAQKSDAIQKTGWHKIGEVVADLNMEAESIIIPKPGKYKAIKLEVLNAPIKLLALKIYYEGDVVEEIPLQCNLKKNEETKVVDILKDKNLQKITFTYEVIRTVKANTVQVDLFGLK